MADKGKRGGKYSATVRGQGYFGNDDAGNRKDFTAKQYGTKREFIGSKTKEYTFSDLIHGTQTITATSYQEALRIAMSRGYTRGDYKKR